MQKTTSFYGSKNFGTSRTIQDFGLCTSDGAYVQTTKSRTKGFLVVLFFDLTNQASVSALKMIDAWGSEIAPAKISILAVVKADRDSTNALATDLGLKNVTLLLDHESYQARNWGVSTFPSLYVIEGKSGRVLAKVIGADSQEINAAQSMLQNRVSEMLEAEEKAKRAEEEKKAAEAAAKSEEPKK